VVPLNERTASLERALFDVAIHLRDFLLHPEAERRARYATSLARVRTELRLLHELEKPPRTAALYGELVPLVSSWLLETERAVAQRTTQLLDSRTELELALARERALEAIGRLSEHQAVAARQALESMATARASVERGLSLAAVAALLSFAAVAVLVTQSIRTPARALLSVARSFEQGDWRRALAFSPADAHGERAPRETRSEMAQLARAFGAAAAALERRERRLVADAGMAAATAGSLERVEIARAALRVIVEEVRAEAAVLYGVAGNMLEPVATYALDGVAAPLPIGHGIPGEAARDRRLLLVSEVPPDTPFKISLGYMEAPPRAVAALPIVARDEIHGVLLVASLNDLDESALSFLRSASAQLAVGLQNAAAHDEIGLLLQEVQRINARIEAQNSALQAQNEEMQAQDEELQAQSEEIRAQNDQLREQTDELRRYAQRLSQADEQKNRFLAVLAHELRNPMAAIVNALYLTKRAQPGSEQALRAQVLIARQVEHLKRLIDDLLDVTRISEGKITLQRQPLDLVQAARECVEDQRGAAERGGVTLEIQAPRERVCIDADSTRLAQIIGNLVGNAIKFSDAGKRVLVSVKAERTRGEAVLSVADEGVGIDPELLSGMFEPFAQAHSTLARTDGGLGLGLALVKALVNLHGGRVEAKSEGSGRGAQFTVRLPLVAAHAAPDIRQQSSDAAHQTALPAAGCAGFMSVAPVARRHRILLVEDNADAADSLCEALRMDGHDVLVARSGPDAIEAIGAFVPGIVLCDIGLPGLDGYCVARELRARCPELLLVAITGYASESDRRRAAEAGFDIHLAKPIDPHRLCELIAAAEAAAPVRANRTPAPLA
jgi:signal transduction histidine kinase/ActR/RegA family two-component response regulator